jgi:hypothetical protein
MQFSADIKEGYLCFTNEGFSPILSALWLVPRFSWRFKSSSSNCTFVAVVVAEVGSCGGTGLDGWTGDAGFKGGGGVLMSFVCTIDLRETRADGRDGKNGSFSTLSIHVRCES